MKKMKKNRAKTNNRNNMNRRSNTQKSKRTKVTTAHVVLCVVIAIAFVSIMWNFFGVPCAYFIEIVEPGFVVLDKAAKLYGLYAMYLELAKKNKGNKKKK